MAGHLVNSSPPAGIIINVNEVIIHSLSDSSMCVRAYYSAEEILLFLVVVSLFVSIYRSRPSVYNKLREEQKQVVVDYSREEMLLLTFLSPEN